MSNVIIDVLKEEEARLDQNIKIFKKKIDQYPKGSLVKKKRKNHFVYYLNYREGSRVISKYVRINELKEIENLIGKRDIVKSKVKNLEAEKKEIQKILKSKRRKENG